MSHHAYQKPRRFPLSRKHRPIRPALTGAIIHRINLPTMSTIGAGLQVKMDALGARGWHTLDLHSLKEYITKKHQAENVTVESNYECRTIECRWTSKPRLGQKNRAYLAAHGIKV